MLFREPVEGWNAGRTSAPKAAPEKPAEIDFHVGRAGPPGIGTRVGPDQVNQGGTAGARTRPSRDGLFLLYFNSGLVRIVME